MKKKELTPVQLCRDNLPFLQSQLWQNNTYKVFFSNRIANEPDSYYWFTYDVATKERQHHLYRFENDILIIEFKGKHYEGMHMVNMEKYDIILIQLQNRQDIQDYINYIGSPLPVNPKTTPYIFNK